MNKIVWVEWVDSRGVTQGWEYTDDLTPLAVDIVHTVGFLLGKDDTAITLAMCLSQDQVLGRLAIPVVAVRELHEVALPFLLPGGALRQIGTGDAADLLGATCAQELAGDLADAL